MRPVQFTVNLDNQSDTKVAAAQTIGAAGNLVLAAAASAIDTSGAARVLKFTTTENDSAISATITGLDADGNSISETLTLPNTTTKQSVSAYASVSQIAVTAAIAANISVGTMSATETAYSRTIPLDFYSRIAPAIKVIVSGTINYTVQECFDDILKPTSLGGTGTASADFQSASASAIVAATATKEAQADVGATGVRLKITSYSSSATAKVQIVTPSGSNLG